MNHKRITVRSALTSGAPRLRSVLLALVLLLYLGFAVLMGIKEGLIAGFLPALLVPIPIILLVVFFGSIPFWASSFGSDWLVAIIWIAQICLIAYASRPAGSDQNRPETRLFSTWAALATINILLWALLGPFLD